MQRRASFGISSISSIRAIAAIAGAFVAGAVVSYFLDPDSGGRRRARVRDGVVRARHTAVHGLIEREHGLLNRGRGLLARIEALAKPSIADDDIVVARIRAHLGHVCSHPHDVEVHARGEGRFELSGAVLDHEHEVVVRALARVPGVRRLEDRLVERGTDAEVLASRGSSPPSAFARVTGPS
jgi:hypothetical protein